MFSTPPHCCLSIFQYGFWYLPNALLLVLRFSCMLCILCQGMRQGKPLRRSTEKDLWDDILCDKKQGGPFSFGCKGDLHTQFPLPLMVVTHMICPHTLRGKQTWERRNRGYSRGKYLICKACGCQSIMNVADIIMEIIGKDTYTSELGL